MDSRLETLKQALESAMEGLTGEQLSWHPAEKWCVAEVLEHLYLTYTGTVKGFEKAIAAGKPLVTPASMVQRARAFVVLGLGYMPGGRTAPENTRPRGLAAEKVREEILGKIAAMDATIAQCEERFGRGVKLLDHPILGPLTGAQWRKFHLVHGRHHQRQILRLRDRMSEGG